MTETAETETETERARTEAEGEGEGGCRNRWSTSINMANRSAWPPLSAMPSAAEFSPALEGGRVCARAGEGACPGESAGATARELDALLRSRKVSSGCTSE